MVFLCVEMFRLVPPLDSIQLFFSSSFLRLSLFWRGEEEEVFDANDGPLVGHFCFVLFFFFVPTSIKFGGWGAGGGGTGDDFGGLGSAGCRFGPGSWKQSSADVIRLTFPVLCNAARSLRAMPAGFFWRMKAKEEEEEKK